MRISTTDLPLLAMFYVGMGWVLNKGLKKKKKGLWSMHTFYINM